MATDLRELKAERSVVAEDALMIEQGVAEGWITPASRTGLEPTVRFRASCSVADALSEDRG